MPWYHYVLDFVCGLVLTNGVPHFVRGVSGSRFQSPFAAPPGVGESSAVTNVVWGFANLAVGFILLGIVWPQGADSWVGWFGVGLGALLAAIFLARHFSAVRSGTR
jgi:hypothetical protein